MNDSGESIPKGFSHGRQRTQWQGQGLLELQAAHFAGDLRQAQQARGVLQVLLVAYRCISGCQRIGDLLQALPCLFPVQCGASLLFCADAAVGRQVASTSASAAFARCILVRRPITPMPSQW